ncbi:putative traB domain-containing protein-like [Sesbania bispinosa]|nr:putative traB domain-containing protein-like [Sesbania bispinosa]
MAHLLTRTRLVRVISSLKTTIPRSQTATKFSTETTASGRRDTVDSDRRLATLPDKLSSNVLVLSCESTAEGGVCDVYVVGTCHVSEVPLLLLWF